MKMKLRKHAWLMMAVGFFILSIIPGNGSENRKHGIVIDPSSNRHFNMLWENIAKTGAGISEEVFSLALRGFSKLQGSNRLSKDSILAIVDFSKSSRKKDFTSSISNHRH
ncbi:MAG: hypothetical protein ACKOBX_02510 [Bacteroidota bacterium]